MIIKDTGSKFGTMVNDVRLIQDADHVLRDHDLLHLGTATQLRSLSLSLSLSSFGGYSWIPLCSFLPNHLRVSRVPVVICLSAMDAQTKTAAQADIAQLGLGLSRQWTRGCTHLILSNDRVTEKVLFALMEAKQIVTLDWLRALKKAPALTAFQFPAESE